jgi:hypothetical protein
MESLGRQLGRKDNLEILVRLAMRVAGRPVRILIESGEDTAVADEPAPPPGVRPAPAERRRPLRGAAHATAAAPADETLLAKATSEPGVKKLLREFGAQVVDIRPLEPPAGSDVES